MRDIPNSSIHINLCPQPPPPLLSTTTEHSKCQNPLNKVSYRWMIQRPPQYCVPIANRRSRIGIGNLQREKQVYTQHNARERERERERERDKEYNFFFFFFVNTFVWLLRKFEGKCLGEWEWEGWMFWLRKSKGKGKCLRLYCLAGNLWVYLILKFKWVGIVDLSI